MPPRLARPLAALAAVASLAFAPRARAQSAAGFAIDRFEPAERGSDWFTAESLDLRGDWRPAAGAVLDYGYRPLVVYRPDGSIKSSIVEDQLFLHVGGDVTFADRVRVGLSIPIAVYELGQGGAANGATYTAPPSSDVGDARLAADLRLLGAYGDPLTFALGMRVHLPSGHRDAYTGDGEVRVEPRAMIAGAYGPLAYSARVGFEYRAYDKTFAGSDLGSELTFGAAAGLKLGALAVGPEAYGGTVLDGAEGPFKTRNTPFELLFGAHAAFAREWRVGAALGPGLSRGYGEPVVRAVASLEWAPPYVVELRDADGDGVLDVEDACPSVPGARTSDPRTDGCPPAPPPDRDLDGVLDVLDACPDAPGPTSDDPRANGCPRDRDGDGVLDAVDACPDAPGVASDEPRTNGCPPDADADGVPDAEDACPAVAGARTADAKTNGCPPDRDADGVLDAVDACPDAPGPRDADPKKNGCPLAYVGAGQIRLSEPVKFRVAKADLDPAGDAVLEAIASVLRDHPEIRRVRVEGHTDSRGRGDANRRLSERRAAAVVAWLAAHGVDRARLRSRGFGASRPVADDATEEGRAANRRVELHIVELPEDGARDGAPKDTPAPRAPNAPRGPRARGAP